MSSPPGASAMDALPTACFSIFALADPGVMPRILALFAKRALIPNFWCSRVSGAELAIDLQIDSLDAGVARYLAACFLQMPSVRMVLTSEKRRKGTP